MYFCSRCGRKISAEEAVIHSPTVGVGENLILCVSCSSQIQRNPAKKTPANRFIRAFLMILAAFGIGLVWFALFYLTAYPWDFLSVLAGWAIARIIIRTFPVNHSSRHGLAAILLTGLAIFTRAYLLLNLVVGYTATGLPNQAGFALLSPAGFLHALFAELSANPFTILMWMLSFWIAYITTIGVRSQR